MKYRYIEQIEAAEKAEAELREAARKAWEDFIITLGEVLGLNKLLHWLIKKTTK